LSGARIACHRGPRVIFVTWYTLRHLIGRRVAFVTLTTSL
jgi:hypothetical protein